MTVDITASCLCGAVQLSCDAPMGPGSYCHCTDCRASGGSAFSVAIPFSSDTFRVTSGETTAFTRQADSGHTLTRHFCPTCGSPLYGTSPDHPGRVYVKAGALHDQSLVHPTHQSWCRSKVTWADIDPTLPSFPKGKT